MNSKSLTNSDITAAALELGVDEATIHAVIDVEAAGSGFIEAGSGHIDPLVPKILFEAHILWKRLKAHGFDPAPLMAGNEDILSPHWNKSLYKGGIKEYQRLEKATLIHLASALESASWGLFQVMGYHWKALGYPSAQEFVNRMYDNEREHLFAFIKYVQVNHLANALRNHDWEAFAEGYNGPGYKANRYDEKLKKAWERWDKK